MSTGVYKIRQALIAQAVGADYVAPYLRRIADGIKQTYSAQPLGTFDDMSEQEYMAGTAPLQRGCVKNEVMLPCCYHSPCPCTCMCCLMIMISHMTEADDRRTACSCWVLLMT